MEPSPLMDDYSEYDDLDELEEEVASNRTFMIIAGALGALIVGVVIILVLFLFVLKPDNGASPAEKTNEAIFQTNTAVVIAQVNTNEAIETQNAANVQTQTADVLYQTQTAAAIPTETPTPAVTNTPEPTATPVVRTPTPSPEAPEVNPETATAQAMIDLTNTLSMADDPDYADNRMEGFLASIALIEFGTHLAADHRADPRDTMTMEVLNSEFEGRQLTDREFGRFFNNLIVGGVETTRNTLSWGMYELIRHPEQFRMLQEDLSLVPDAVEEILRLRNTVVYLRRTATRDLELAGEHIRKGDKVVCLLGSVNHDPRLFAEPERFDISRPRREAVRRNYRTFGAGPHFCIGVHQARLNLVVMFEEIVRRMDEPRLMSEPKQARSIFLDGFKSMRIAFSARQPR